MVYVCSGLGSGGKTCYKFRKKGQEIGPQPAKILALLHRFQVEMAKDRWCGFRSNRPSAGDHSDLTMLGIYEMLKAQAGLAVVSYGARSSLICCTVLIIQISTSTRAGRK